LVCHLLKIKEVNQVKFNSYKGNLFENMIVGEYIKQNYHNNKMEDFWFWRDSAGHEVDLIRQDDDLLNVIEIKSTKTITTDLFKEINYFENLAKDEIKSKSLVYAGNDNQQRTNANVLSWNQFK
jgi:predicted AAA+ superfamily ATPase